MDDKYIRLRDIPSSAFSFDGESVVVERDQLLRIMPPIPESTRDTRYVTPHDQLATASTWMHGYDSVSELSLAILNLWIQRPDRSKEENDASPYYKLLHDLGRVSSRFGTHSVRRSDHVMVFCNDAKITFTFKHKKDDEDYYSIHEIDLVDFCRHYPTTEAGRAELHDFICKLVIAFAEIEVIMSPFYEPLITLEQDKFRMWIITNLPYEKERAVKRVFAVVAAAHKMEWIKPATKIE